MSEQYLSFMGRKIRVDNVLKLAEAPATKKIVLETIKEGKMEFAYTDEKKMHEEYEENEKKWLEWLEGGEE